MSRRKALFGATLLAGLAGWGGAASAADDGYDNVFSSVLTAVGLMPPDRSPEIEYRERAPLVLPPSTTLAKPVEGGVTRSAAWPQDADVIKRRKAAEEARAPVDHVFGAAQEKLSHEELMRGRIAGAGVREIPESALRRAECGNQGNNQACRLDDIREMEAKHAEYEGSGQGDGALAVGQEPDRMYLTQPPKGYMKVTRVVKATAEAPKPKVDESNPASQLVYHDNPDE